MRLETLEKLNLQKGQLLKVYFNDGDWRIGEVNNVTKKTGILKASMDLRVRGRPCCNQSAYYTIYIKDITKIENSEVKK